MRLWIASEILLGTGRSHSYYFSFLPLSISVSLSLRLPPFFQQMLLWVKEKAPIPISQANLLAFYTAFGSEQTAHQHKLSAVSDPLCAAVAQHCLTRYASRTNTIWTSLLFDMIPSTGQNSHQDASTICHAHICSHQCKKTKKGCPNWVAWLSRLNMLCIWIFHTE